MSRILVVYYSLGGNTARVAEDIARRCGAVLDPIREVRPRAGIGGYMRAAWEALRGRTVSIRSPEQQPGAYDVVVLGTPVWAGRISSPMRACIEQHADGLQRVAFFCTEGGSGGERVFDQMARLTGCTPVSSLIVTARELDTGDHESKVEAFATALGRIAATHGSRRAEARAVRPAESQAGREV